MSFLLVTGKIYHCLNCGSSLQVEYQGGPMITQVGDNNVFYFLKLEEKYKSNAGKDLYNAPVYLHEEAICEDCVDKSLVLSEKLLGDIHSLEGISGDADSLREEFVKCLFQSIEENDLEWLKCVDVSAYEGMVNSKYMLMPHEKDGQVIPIIVGQKEQLISQYLSGIGSNIMEILFNSFPQLIEKLLSAVKEIRHDFESAMEKTRKELPGHGKCVYIGKDITQSENLNSYLMYEATVRVPDENASQVKVYYDATIDFEKMGEWLTELDGFATSQYYQQNEELVEMIKGILYRRLEKEFIGN